MTLVEKYLTMQKQLSGLRALDASEEEIDSLLDKMDVVWNGFTDVEVREVEDLSRARRELELSK